MRKSHLHYTGPFSLQTGLRTLTASLLDDQGAPIAGRALSFAVDAEPGSVTAVTDAVGVARATMLSAETGPATVIVAFGGDSVFSPSRVQQPVLGYQPTSYAVWGGNPGGLKVGQQVSFWGPSWVDQVRGGDYDSHADFKGHVDSLSAFRCCQPTARSHPSKEGNGDEDHHGGSCSSQGHGFGGAHHSGARRHDCGHHKACGGDDQGAQPPQLAQGCWSADPGLNDEPQDLPEYIGVIVPTSITQSQGIIFGNISAMAVVQVDSGSRCHSHPKKKRGFGTVVHIIDCDEIPSSPVITAAQSQPGEVLPGQSFDVTATLANVSSVDALQVVVSEQFQGTEPASAQVQLGTLAAGGQKSAVFARVFAPIAQRGPAEGIDEYDARLASLDGRVLSSTGTVTFADPSGQPTLPIHLESSSKLVLPRLTLTLSSASQAFPNTTVSYAVTVANIGSAPASTSTVVLTLPDGTQRTLSLGALAAGATVSAAQVWTVPAIAARISSESNEDYDARLASFDEKGLAATAHLSWTDAAGNSYGLIDRSASSVERVPILGATEPAGLSLLLLPGQSQNMSFNVDNSGGGNAFQVTLGLANPDGSTSSAVPFDLSSGQASSVTIAAQAPAIAPKANGEADAAYLARLRSADAKEFDWSLGWQDAVGNRYGSISGSLAVRAVLPVVVVSLGGPAAANAGDAIEYVISAQNVGHSDASGLVFTLTLPDGSVRTQSGGLLAAGGASSPAVSFKVPYNFPNATATATLSWTWSDAASNSYGPVVTSFSTQISAGNRAPIVSSSAVIALPASGRIVVAHDVNTLGGGYAGPNEDLFAVNVARWLTNSMTGKILALESSPGDGTRNYAPSVKSALTNAGYAVTYVSAPDTVMALTLSDLEQYDAVFVGITFPRMTSISTSVLTDYVNGGGNVYVYGGVDGSPAQEAPFLNPFLKAFGLAYDLVSYNGLSSVNVASTHPIFTGLVGKTLLCGNGQDIHNLGTNPNAAIVQYQGTHGVFAVVNGSTSTFTLSGSVTDDGLPLGSVLTATWSEVSGPAPVSFTNPTVTFPDVAGQANSVSTDVAFSAPGMYTLALTASDSQLNGNSFVTLRVGSPQVPSILWVDPNIGQQGQQNESVSLIGRATHWAQGQTVATFGAGITVVSLTVSSATRATAVLAIDPNAAGGSRDVAVTTGTEVVTLSNGFTVTTTTPQLTAVSPSSGFQGEQNKSVALTGQFTNFSQGATTVSFGAGVTVVSLNVVSSTNAIAVLDIDPTAASGSRDVTVTTGTEVVTLSIGFTVATTTPQLTAVSPSSGLQGENESVVLTGQFTHFVQGATTASFGAGVTVVSLNVTSSTDATAVLDIDPAATPGERSVTLTTGAEAVTLANGFTVQSIDQNMAPVVNAGPDQVISTDTVTLVGSVTDDGLPAWGTLAMQWTLVSGPGTVWFTTPTEVRTLARFGAVGTYVLRLTATDGEKTSSSDVTVSAYPGNAAPVVTLGPDQTLVYPSRTTTVAGSATDDGMPPGSALSYQWSVTDGPGTVTFATPEQPTTKASFSFPGSYRLRLTVSDSLATGTAELTVKVGAPGGGLPVVSLASPADGAQVTSPAPVVGSVSEGAWKVEYALGGDESVPLSWVALGSGDGPVTRSALGKLDPTMLLNGVYTLRLTATTDAGSASESIGVVVDKNLKVGNFTVAFTDLAVPVLGLPIELTRTYDSRDKTVGDFGVGWRLGIQNVRVEKTASLGRFWEETKEGYFAFPTYCVRTTKPTIVSVTFPDNRVYRFRAVSMPECQSMVPLDIVEFGFEAMPGTHGTLTTEGTSTVMIDTHVGLPGPVVLQDFDQEGALGIYNTKSLVLTTEDGTVYHLQQGVGVTSMRDVNGNTLTVSRDGVTHSSGKKVAFERDAAGRIVRITDPSGNAMSYGYDARGDLASFTDREGSTTSYGYNSTHGLLSIQDPRGIQPIRNEYDSSGRLLRHTDAFGKTIEYTHDLSANREIVTDRLGRQRMLEYDGDGNIVRETDAQGRVTTRTFDADGNRLTETNGAGETTSYTYDALSNMTSQTDAMGNVTRYEYGLCRKLTKTTDPRGQVTSTTYRARPGFLCPTTPLTTTDAAGNVTKYVYADNGEMLSRTDALGKVSAYEYDAHGNQTKETNALGVVTASTYDAKGNRLTETTTRTTAAGGVETLNTRYSYDKNGRLLSRTDPDGTITRTEYDALGKRVSATEKLGRVTRYQYDAMGRLEKTSFPDGTFESSTYDAEGRAMTSTDRAGHVTGYEYDEVGRLTKTTFADGATSQSVYDAAGRLVASRDGNGNTTRYEYDAAGRRSKVTDALGHSTQYAYDAAGNLVSAIDAKGQVTSYEYDAVGNRVRTVLADGTVRQTGYDALGRQVSETDQAGKVTKYGYDALGRLTSVTDAKGQVTSYGYDERGNRVSQTDANGHVTRFEYDALGRETKRTLPDGKSELKGYDAAGNLANRTNFLGQTASYVYDAANRPVERRYPGGAVVSFGYTATGRRASASDARGMTAYLYDQRDRLVGINYPDGRSLAFGYDPQGNRTQLKATVGGTEYSTGFTFDAVNRLDTVTDPAGQRYVHGYDANGNRESLTHPNGVATSYAYDALNRLRSLSTTKGAFAIQGYAFTLGPTGNRTKIDETDGTSREYTYDDLYRLTGETVTKAGAVQYAGGFTYDAVGNRLSQTKYGVLTNSSYDERDRLLADGSATYGWDDEGNLGSKTGVEGATYEWDFDHRLKKVTKTDGTVVEHAYDTDGGRVQTKTTKDGVATVQNYLVDTSGGLSHVVAETDEAELVRTLYVRGDDLLAVIRPGGTKYVHADGLGSIRKLTDESGAVTDSYTYSAFGELLDHVGSDPQPFMFAGEAWEGGTGLYYNRARWLDVGTGRFVSEDSWGGWDDLPLTLHRYLYSELDPVLLIDPTGNDSLGGQMAALSISGLMATMAVSTYYSSLQRARDVSWDIDLSYDVAIEPFEIFPLSRGKGERGRTAKPEGTGNPFKHMKPVKGKPDKVQYRDADGKKIEKPKPDGFDDYWKSKYPGWNGD